MTFMSLVAAVLLSASAVQAGPKSLPDESVGPFKISSATIPDSGFPYPQDYKTVVLAWESSDGAARFRLVDDGGSLKADFQDDYRGSFRCGITTGQLRLNKPPKSYFRILTDGGCSNVEAARKLALQREIGQAAPFLGRAFERFRIVSRAYLGPSERRCVKYRFGDHGPICSRYRGKRK